MAEYEQDHQRSRRSHAENEMGKNYLLEAYLNGLPDGKNENTANSCGNRNNNNNKNDDGNEIDKEITTPGNSDSGVNTEEIATSPEIGTQSPLTNDSGTNSIDNNNDDTKKVANLMDSTALTTICKRLSIREKPPKKQSTRKLNEKMTRETKLIMEHVNRKEFCAKMEKERLTENQTDGMVSQSKPLNVDDHLAGQIELLEKVIAINKHIQHEEELLVRLNAKMRKYEIDDPNLTETEMKVVLNQLNTNIESSKNELVKTEHELNESTEMLENKSKIVKELSKELAALELNERKSNENQQCLIQVPSHQIQIHANNCEPHDIPQQQPLQTPSTIAQLPNLQTQISNVPSTSNQMTLPLLTTTTTTTPSAPKKPIKTGTLPKLISSALKKTTQISAKNTFCGTIPKRPQCNQITATNINRSAVTQSTVMPAPAPTTTTPVIITPNNGMLSGANNQSFIVPDHVILSQAPLFFQKDNFNGNFMQSIDQRNINPNNHNQHNQHTICNFNSNSININNASSMANCGKIGPKKLMNGLYKDPDSDTGLSSLGDDGLQHIGTLV